MVTAGNIRTEIVRNFSCIQWGLMTPLEKSRWEEMSNDCTGTEAPDIAGHVIASPYTAPDAVVVLTPPTCD